MCTDDSGPRARVPVSRPGKYHECAAEGFELFIYDSGGKSFQRSEGQKGRHVRGGRAWWDRNIGHNVREIHC